jgi:hypothetical protein
MTMINSIKSYFFRIIISCSLFVLFWVFTKNTSLPPTFHARLLPLFHSIIIIEEKKFKNIVSLKSLSTIGAATRKTVPILF